MYTCDQQLECHKFSTTYPNNFFIITVRSHFHGYINFVDFAVAFRPQNSVLIPCNGKRVTTREKERERERETSKQNMILHMCEVWCKKQRTTNLLKWYSAVNTQNIYTAEICERTV